jgi:hypothetical protein
MHGFDFWKLLFSVSLVQTVLLHRILITLSQIRLVWKNLRPLRNRL